MWLCLEWIVYIYVGDICLRSSVNEERLGYHEK